MTAFDIVTEYVQRYGSLPPEGDEYNEIADYVRSTGVTTVVGLPEPDSIIAVCAMLRARQQGASGQGRLL